MKAKKLSNKTLCLFSLVLSAFLYNFASIQVGPLVDLRLKAIDTFYQIQRELETRSKPSEIVIIGIDDESFKALNRSWPWGREVFAAFIDKVSEFKPKVLAIDFSFFGVSSNPLADEALSSSLEKAGNVILASFFDRDLHYYVEPDKAFSSKAKGVGFVDKSIDRDGVIRRVRLSYEGVPENPGRFSFAAEAVAAYWEIEPDSLLNVDYGRKEYLFTYPDIPTQAHLHVPADSRGRVWLSQRHKRSDLSYIPFWKIIGGKVDPAAIEGKIVVLGPVSPVFHDHHRTPLDLNSGVVLNANEMLMILHRDFLYPVSPELIQLISWLFMILGFLLFYRDTHLRNLIFFLCLEALIYLAALFLFINKSTVAEPFSPMFLLAVVYGITLFFKTMEIRNEKNALKEMVVMDALTGLYGYRYLSVRLESELSKARREGRTFYVVMADIDHFKKVNDIYGHEEGNRVLKEIAHLLKEGIRNYDVAARYGGEEFTLILFHPDDATVKTTLERIRQAIEKHTFRVTDICFNVTISMGVASSKSLGPDETSPEKLIKNADEALYHAKKTGRNCVVLFNEITQN